MSARASVPWRQLAPPRAVLDVRLCIGSRVGTRTDAGLGAITRCGNSISDRPIVVDIDYRTFTHPALVWSACPLPPDLAPVRGALAALELLRDGLHKPSACVGHCAARSPPSASTACMTHH